MKTITMTASAKSTKTHFQGANEGEQCRIASTGDYLVGMESAKAGTTVKVTEIDQTEQEAIEKYKQYYMTAWQLNEADALIEAQEEVKLMQSLASHFNIGDKANVRISKSGRITMRSL